MVIGQFHFHMSHAQHEELEYYNQFILTLPLNILMALPRKVFAVIGIKKLLTAVDYRVHNKLLFKQRVIYCIL